MQVICFYSMFLISSSFINSINDFRYPIPLINFVIQLFSPHVSFYNFSCAQLFFSSTNSLIIYNSINIFYIIVPRFLCQVSQINLPHKLSLLFM